MILKLPENRKKIIDYLEKIDEDTFIDEVIIPFFTSQGYQVYRISSHGSGEHGKDIIFSRYVPLFFENEFVAVQAKAEKVTTSNVAKFSDQVKRALNTKFAPRSGAGDLSPHYVVFINARKHSNEAYTEFPQLVNSPHAKILSQENVCELMIQSGIGPKRLVGQLSKSTPETQSEEDKIIFETILGNSPAKIDNLLEHRLKFLKDEIAPRTKELIVDYIYDRWQMDRSWVGTIKPMKWFDRYFGFFSQKNSKYLLDVLDELLSSTPSFNALPYTESVVRKITPELLAPVVNEFINLCARRAISYPKAGIDVVFQKLQELRDAQLINNTNDIELADKVLLIRKYERDDNAEKREEIEKEIRSVLWPDRGH